MRAVEAAQHLVVIARNVDDARALARLAQKLLHHVVVRLRQYHPDFSAQPSTMSPMIDRFGVVFAQEVEKALGLAPSVPRCTSEMNSAREVKSPVAVIHGHVPSPLRMRSGD